MEVSQEARALRAWHLPDAEEAEDMVDAEGVEVAGLTLEALAPPAEVTSLLHTLPVVRGEAPVLPVGSEVIGWGACGLLRVEERWCHPDVDAVGRYADGEVTLEEDASLLSIATYRLELAVEDELQPVVIAYLLSMCRIVKIGSCLSLVIHFPSRPVAGCARAKLVTQDAVEGVGTEPSGGFVVEEAEVLAREVGLTLQLECTTEEALLQLEYAWVVHGGELA